MRDGADTKQRIERAAMELFVRQGIAETSIREVAKAAGVSQGAMYNHYVSKDELAWQLFSQHFGAIGAELHRRQQALQSIHDKLLAMIHYAFELFDQDWVLVTYVFWVRHRFLNRGTWKHHNPYLVFKAAIVEAVRRGEIPKQNADLAASLVIGSVIQVIDSKILNQIEPNLAKLSGQVAAACTRLLH